jgi:hypothetical protein
LHGKLGGVLFTKKLAVVACPRGADVAADKIVPSNLRLTVVDGGRGGWELAVLEPCLYAVVEKSGERRRCR